MVVARTYNEAVNLSHFPLPPVTKSLTRNNFNIIKYFCQQFFCGGGGQRPLEMVEGATSLAVRLQLPYLTFVFNRNRLK